jgi:molecular chaperone GrpE (heat shock protein)
VFSWFRRAPVSLPPPPVDERPAWVDELTEAVQKQSRAAAKQSARLEATLGEIDARIAQLGATIARTRSHVAPGSDDAFELVFDALDALDAARALARDPHLADGLSRVGERLARFCEQRGFQRVTGLGSTPDAAVMRVVGTEPSAEQAAGNVVRVVRAAVLRGDQVVREGNVIVSAPEGEHEQRLGN